MGQSIHRIQFIDQGLIQGGRLSVAPTIAFNNMAENKVQIGMIGVGLRRTKSAFILFSSYIH